MTNYDEQRTRTIAGWIGVEISRSRVRMPGKPGFGLYRVRVAAERHWHVGQPPVVPVGEWTAYAFTLQMIAICVDDAIRVGMPSRPGPLRLRNFGHGWADEPDAVVPTRWTHRYQGRRDLGTLPEERDPRPGGMSVPVSVKPGVAAELDRLSALTGATRFTVDPVTGGFVPDMESVIAGAAERRIATSVRRRALNRTAAREFAERRKHGLVRRHAAKSARLGLS